MPEGPSIVLLKEEVLHFEGKKVMEVSGNSKIDQSRLRNKTVMSIQSWGKHFLICFKGFTLRIHFMLFGSYSIDVKKPNRLVRLSLRFRNGEINFYACSVKYLEGHPDDHYDWSADVMHDAWDPVAALKKVKAQPDAVICDVLLDQEIFAGVGNIIKNEILYRVRVHPESVVRNIPLSKLKRLIDETRIYSFQFLAWKRDFVLKKHWLAHSKKVCLRCNHPIVRKITGVRKRRSFICANCQRLY